MHVSARAQERARLAEGGERLGEQREGARLPVLLQRLDDRVRREVGARVAVDCDHVLVPPRFGRPRSASRRRAAADHVLADQPRARGAAVGVGPPAEQRRCRSLRAHAARRAIEERASGPAAARRSSQWPPWRKLRARPSDGRRLTSLRAARGAIPPPRAAGGVRSGVRRPRREGVARPRARQLATGFSTSGASRGAVAAASAASTAVALADPPPRAPPRAQPPLPLTTPRRLQQAARRAPLERLIPLRKPLSPPRAHPLSMPSAYTNYRGCVPPETSRCRRARPSATADRCAPPPPGLRLAAAARRAVHGGPPPPVCAEPNSCTNIFGALRQQRPVYPVLRHHVPARAYALVAASTVSAALRASPSWRLLPERRHELTARRPAAAAGFAWSGQGRCFARWRLRLVLPGRRTMDGVLARAAEWSSRATTEAACTCSTNALGATGQRRGPVRPCSTHTPGMPDISPSALELPQS